MPFEATFKVRKTGRLIDRLFSCRAQVPKVLHSRNDPDGRKGLRAGEVADHVPFTPQRSTRGPAKYPVISDSFAIDPALIEEGRRTLGTDFTPDGRAIITSRSHRLSLLKRAGWRENS